MRFFWGRRDDLDHRLANHGSLWVDSAHQVFQSTADHAFLMPAPLLGDTSPLLCHHSTSASCPLLWVRELGEPKDMFVSYARVPLQTTLQEEHLSHEVTLGQRPSPPFRLCVLLACPLFWPGGTNSEELFCLPRASFAPTAPGRNSLYLACLALKHPAMRSCSGATCFGQLLHLGKRKDRPLFHMDSVLFITLAYTQSVQHSRHVPAGIPGACLQLEASLKI